MMAKIKGLFVVVGSMILATFFVAGAVYAATTISTDINTGGALTVAGLSLLNGQASTTQLTATRIYVGTSTTTTIRGDGGISAFAGDVTIPGGNSIDTVSGTLNIGNANASALTIGRAAVTTTFPGIIAVTNAGGTSTFAYGINLPTGGCFAIAGTCVGSSTGASLSANNTWTGTQTFGPALLFSTAGGIDTVSSFPFYIGTSTANAVKIGKSGATTTILGGFAVTSTTATSSFSYGINLPTGGCFAIANICIGSSTGATLSANNTWTGTQAFSASATTTFGGSIGFTGPFGIDTTIAVPLYVGTSTASAITIGRSSITTTFPGPIAAASSILATSTFGYGINLPTGGCFAIAGTCVGSSTGASLSANNTWTGTQTFTGTASTTFAGPIGFSGVGVIDSANGTSLYIGTTSAAAVTIGRSGNTTTFPGTVQANGPVIHGSGGTAVNSLVFGACTLSSGPISGTTFGTSSQLFTCSGATGVTSSHRIFVQATSSLPSNFILQSASATSSGVISVQIYNSATSTQTVPATSINFFGIL